MFNTLKFGICLFLFVQLITESRQQLKVQGQKKTGPFAYGEKSTGYVTIMEGGSLTQTCNQFGLECGAVEGGTMSSLFVGESSSLTQETLAIVKCADYTFVTLENGCSLTMKKEAGIQPNPDFGGGRIEVVCSGQASWNLAQGSYINIDRQGKIQVEADFDIGSYVFIMMEPAATINVQKTFTIEDHVQIFLRNSSLLEISATSGGQVGISSSKNGDTVVTLDKSARIIANGTMAIGNGESVSVTIGKSGSLIIGDKGQFVVENNNFEIGPSSFWVINGNFKLDGYSQFSSGMQSNLTIAPGGSMETNVGSLHVAPFSSFVVQGYCQNSAHLTTSEYSRFVVGPRASNPELLKGQYIAKENSKLYLAEWSTAQILGYLLSQSSEITIGERGNLLLTETASASQHPGCAIKIGPGASLNITGLYSGQNSSILLASQASLDLGMAAEQKSGSVISLGVQAEATFMGICEMEPNTEFFLKEDAEVSFHDNFHLQTNGNGIAGIYAGEDSIMKFIGLLTIVNSIIHTETQSDLTALGALTLQSKATMHLEQASSVYISTAAKITINGGLLKTETMGNLILSGNSRVSIGQEDQMNAGNSITVGSSAFLELSNDGHLEINSGTLSIDDRSSIAINGSFSISTGTTAGKPNYMGKESSVIIPSKGNLQITSKSFISINNRADFEIDGSVTLNAGSSIQLGPYASFYIPQTTTITLLGSNIILGKRSSFTFCPGKTCVLLSKDYIVPPYQQTANICGPPFTCF